MMKFIPTNSRVAAALFFISSFLFLNNHSFAQCGYTAGGSNFWCSPGIPAPTTAGQSVSCNNMYAGEIVRVLNMTAGCTYRISTCGASYDTQLTIYPQGGGGSLGYNDDNGPACSGVPASLDFIPSVNGNYDVKLNQYFCTSNTTLTPVTVTLLSCPVVTGPCPLSAHLEGGTNLVPPCGTQNQTQQGSGTYSSYSVVNGAQYEFETCASPFNTQLTGYNPSNTVVFYNDDNGPVCTGDRASVLWNSNFSGTLRIMVNRFSCLGFNGSGTGNSAILRYRQINNINIQSTNFTCPNQSIALSATPSGGTWSGAGVTGSAFQAAVAGVYPVTYTIGQCSSQYSITVGTNSQTPSGIIANPSSTVCSGTQVTLSVNGGTLGNNAQWAWYSGTCGGTFLGNGGSIIITANQNQTYFVRAEGGCGTPTQCASLTITVNTPSTAPTTANITPSTPVCPGTQISLSVSGGTLGTGAQYVWYTSSCGGVFLGNGPLLNIPAPASPTIYYVRAEGACGNTACASVQFIPQASSTAPSGVFASSTDICAGAPLTLNVVGGSLGIGAQWVWYSGPSCCTVPIGTGTSISPSPTQTINYYVRAEGGCGNTSTAQTTITVRPTTTLPNSILATRDTICTGSQVTLSLNGGSLGYNAQWEWYSGACPPNSGATFITVNTTGQLIVQLTATTTFYLRAVGDCEPSGTACVSKTIFVSGGVGVTITKTDVSCFGGSDGTATANPQGGLAPFTYLWSNSQTTQTATGLSPGSWSVTVTDAGGCSVPGSTNIQQPAPLQISNIQKTDVQCGGDSSGSITITAIGGVSPYEYSADGGTIYQTSNVITNLSAGTYNVAVKDANGCETFSPTSTIINEPPVLSVSASTTDASCVGVNDGTITASASGGTGSIQYSINGSPFQPAGFFSGLSGGVYVVLVQDQIGCQATDTVTIDNSSTIVLTVHTVIDVLCAGTNTGGFEANATGGIGPYNYTVNGFTYQQSGVFSNLSAGTYQLLVVDAAGCQASATIDIDQPTLLTASISSVINIGCFGQSDGEIEINVNGGTTPYGFLWSNGATTQNLSGVAGGSYTVTVTDDRGCTVTTGTVITESPELFVNLASIEDVTCAGRSNGKIDITVLGGKPQYTFTWSNGATTEDLINVIAGTYEVTVVDANGCSIVRSYDIDEPAALSLNANTTAPDCNATATGSISLNVSGGTLPYTYLWSNFSTTSSVSGLSSGTYVVIVTDGNGCTISDSYTLVDPTGVNVTVNIVDASCNGSTNGSITLSVSGGTPGYDIIWSTGATTQNISSLAAGSYSVTVEDQNGCSFVGTYNIGEPSAITVTSNVVNANCTGSVRGSIDITVTGGTPGYTYSWSNGAATQDIANLLAGTYTVTITDNAGCSASFSFGVSQTNGLAVTGTATNISCNGSNNGSVVTIVTGATLPVSYAWSNGATTPNIFNLSAGTYNVTVTDAQGCIAVETFTITQPNAINIALLNITDANCALMQTGSISVNVTGGTGTLSYSWSNGATTQNISNLSGGTYILVVTDANGCSATSTYNVDDPSAPSASVTVITNVSCSGAANGAVTVSVSGGNPGYSFAWSNGATTQNISGLSAGVYNLTITDQNNCTYQLGILINEPNAIVINFNVVDGTCQGGLGSVSAVVSGGAGGYSYAWSNGPTTAHNPGLSAGTYTVTVTDANNCTAEASANVSQAGTLDITASVANVACNGNNTGSVQTIVTGGTAPFTYSWNNGASSKDLFLVAAGTYTVTVTDADGCIRVRSFTVNQASAISISAANIQAADCANTILGSIDINVSGGTPAYAYLWSNFETTQNVSNLIAGNYIVVVTDANGCSASQSFLVDDLSTNLSANVLKGNISCFGANDGNVTVNGTGGAGGYTYLWNTGATTQSLSGLTAGLYSVTLEDASGCQYQAGVLIDEPDALIVSLAVTDGDCSGATGSIDASVSGGTGPYQYVWSHGPTTQDVVGLSAGTYTITVADVNSCTFEATANVSQAGNLDVLAAVDDATCNGLNTGRITTTVINGTLPYTFEWSNGAFTPNLNSVGAGTYTVTVTDANGCVRVRSFTVGEPFEIQAVANNITDADCIGGTFGSIDISVSGGAGNYTYLWSNFSTTQDINNLIAGNYTVIVTDINGCSTAASFTVNDVSNNISVAETVTDVTCGGANDGAISIVVSGGTQPYSYSWSNGGGNVVSISGLSGGLYAVTITDGAGCSFTDSYIVDEPDALQLSAQITNVTCNGSSTGVIDLVVSGGTAPYNYIWSIGATSQDLINVFAGAYSVTVTDDNGCSALASVSVAQPATLNINATVVNPGCNGAVSGSIQLNVSGGTVPYTYNWDNGATTSSISGLAIGSYQVTVTDANNCTAVQAFTISQPTPLAVTGTSTDADCALGILGSVDITVSGGTLPYIYNWNNGATTQDISGLFAGTYVVTVTDGSNCFETASFTVVDLSNNISVSETITDASCPSAADGAIDVIVSGGTAPYTYTWNTGATTADISGLTSGNYSVTILDDAGCGFFAGYFVDEPDAIDITGTVVDGTCAGGSGSVTLAVSGGLGGPYGFSWSNGSSNQNLPSVFAGTYTVTVTDGGGCTASASFNVSQAGDLDVVAAINNVSCNGSVNGSIFTTIIAGLPPYSYAWNNGAISGDLVNLALGTYTVSVTDAQGCIRVSSFDITQPAPVQIVSGLVTNVACYGASTGSIDIVVSGGSGVYTYLWSTFENSQNISGKAAGTYSVIVTDNNGCSTSATYTITQPSQISATASITNVSCFGETDGEISVTVSGGTPPYTYNWDNGETTAIISGLSAGTFNLTVTDANSCEEDFSYTVTEPAQIILNATITNATCFGFSNGSIDLSVSGGTSPYTYNWNNGATTQDISGLIAGTYIVTVTDDNGCTETGSFVVGEPSEIIVIENITNVSCFGESNGSITLAVGGGTPFFSYSWSNGLSTRDVFNLTAGNYSVTVRDANSCEVVRNFTVTQPAPLVATAAITNASCFGLSDGAIDITVAGGIPNYTFAWSNGATTEDLSGLSAGTYILTVTDANNCRFVGVYVVSEPALLILNATVTNVSCFGGNDGAIDITMSGGTAPYGYNWADGSTDEDRTGLTLGSYTVTVSDANGCSVVETINVNEPTELLVTATVQHISCFGATDGFVDLNVSGGTPSYTFNWSNAATTEDIYNLDEGTYNVTVTDANGCTFTGIYTITEPTALVLTYTSVNVTCFGGSDGEIDITVTGGTSPYTYEWSNRETTEDLTGTQAGTYTVTVTDANGCTITETITITEPDQIIANALVSDVSCSGGNDGQILVIISGGVQPYTYNWSNGATTADIFALEADIYTLTVIDANLCGVQFIYTINQPDSIVITPQITDVLCYGNTDGEITVNITGGVLLYTYNWSSGGTTNTISGVGAGVYTVTVTDLNNCQKIDSFTISQPDSISSLLVPVSASCSGYTDGSIDLTVSGGVGPYNFFWSTFEFTEDIGNLPGGRYVVLITDANGCLKIDSVIVDVPDPLEIIAIPKGAGCGTDANGEIGVSVFGGTPPYSFAWNTGDTTQNLTNLPAGQYSVTVTDTNSCFVSRTITVSSLPKPIAEFSFDNVCFGNAALFINNSQIPSGTMTYRWDFGNNSTSTNINPAVLYGSAGTYNVTLIAESDRGCLDSITKAIAVYELPESEITIGGIEPGECVTDTAFLSVPFDEDNIYLWSTGESSNEIISVQSGNFRVTVTNEFGCVSINAVEVYILNRANVSISNDTTISLGFSVMLEATGGFSYEWSPAESLDNPFASNPFANPEVNTTYTVVISDINGCSITRSVTVSVLEDFNLGVPNLFSPNGDGINDVWAIFNVETYPKTSVIIFNRWGNKVWETDDYQNNWDGTAKNGKELPDGTYFYIITVGGSDKQFKGDINILR